MDAPSFGRALIGIGALIALVGVLLVFKDKIPGLDRIGRLPGDLYYQKDGVSFYFPLATSIVLSVVLSVILWLVRSFK